MHLLEYVQEYTKWQPQKRKLSKIPLWMPLRGPHRSVLGSLGFFAAAILYISGNIPTNAYAILVAIVQQEFEHPKFKHPNGIPNRRRDEVEEGE